MRPKQWFAKFLHTIVRDNCLILRRQKKSGKPLSCIGRDVWMPFRVHDNDSILIPQDRVAGR